MSRVVIVAIVQKAASINGSTIVSIRSGAGRIG
jgi:hypothetical protein